MPELPEVESLKLSLTSSVMGAECSQVVVLENRLRRLVDISSLKSICRGGHLISVTRRGKGLILCWQKKKGQENTLQGLLIHLGMSGSLRLAASEGEIRKHDHIIWSLRIGKDSFKLFYNDPRRFGFVSAFDRDTSSFFLRDELDKRDSYLARLGCEPLSRGFSANKMLLAAARRTRAIKIHLMDAAIVVGVGNIYASESLFKARISPHRPANMLSLEDWRKLIKCIKAVLKKAIKAGGTTLRDHKALDGESGWFQNKLEVYGRAGKDCSNCHKPIVCTRQSGRSTFYCSACQL